MIFVKKVGFKQRKEQKVDEKRGKRRRYVIREKRKKKIKMNEKIMENMTEN